MPTLAGNHQTKIVGLQLIIISVLLLFPREVAVMPFVPAYSVFRM
jgi:hypothetical protein